MTAFVPEEFVVHFDRDIDRYVLLYKRDRTKRLNQHSQFWLSVIDSGIPIDEKDIEYVGNYVYDFDIVFYTKEGAIRFMRYVEMYPAYEACKQELYRQYLANVSESVAAAC